jgi:hypothetical protein
MVDRLQGHIEASPYEDPRRAANAIEILIDRLTYLERAVGELERKLRTRGRTVRL